MIQIEIDSDPVPQQRPRFFNRKGKSLCYDPQAKKKEEYRWQIRSQFRDEAIKCPVSVLLTFYMPIPKSTSSVKKIQMKNGVIAHTKKPDLDNMQKFILDCLNKIVFEDDSQVCEIFAKKIYSSRTGTLVRIKPLADTKEGLLYENAH